jgi:wyosine [tRNA(Phe)-imidazoG37] synthetase (radical SAM superfamily)
VSEKGGESHVFGPVPSRRLGRSLGIDLVPSKTCTLDCVYCQVGRTTMHTVERAEYVPADAVVDEVLARLASGVRPDYLTVSGSGEPTLNTAFGEVIRRLSAETEVSVALITNGTLLTDPEVRRGAAGADVVLPSLDAGTEEVFRRLNRPHASLTLGGLVEGLVSFREEYRGRIWLELFMVKNLNTSTAEVGAMKAHVDRIRPDRIQLNTAVRPAADAQIVRMELEELERIAAAFGPEAEVVADYSRELRAGLVAGAEEVFDMLKRRPATVDDVAAGLGIRREEAGKYLSQLESLDKVRRQVRGKETYFVTTS